MQPPRSLFAFWLALPGALFAAEPAPKSPAPAAPNQPPMVSLPVGSFLELPPPRQTEVWTPEPPVIQAPVNAPPSDAIVLFDGRNLDEWVSVKTPGAPAPWKLAENIMIVEPRSGGIRTKRAFRDVQLHLEFRSPPIVKGEGQGRGNSGVMFMTYYEVQVLDSYNNKTYVNGQVGSIYKQHIPLANPSRPPGEWQTYDIVFVAPRFGPAGVVRSPARVTVFLNGVVVQHDVEIIGQVVFRGYPSYRPHADRMPLELQDHGDLVAYRNIWVRELNLP